MIVTLFYKVFDLLILQYTYFPEVIGAYKFAEIKNKYDENYYCPHVTRVNYYN